MRLDHDAIRRAYPTVAFIDDKGSVILDESGNPVTVEQSKIDAARVTLDAEFAALDYVRNREKEYPDVVDQLDKMFHSGFQAWKDEIQKVKEKYPKP